MERSSSEDQVKDFDWISKLPDDVLLVILSRLSTEEAVRTSLVSKRWEHVWKHISHLVLDMSRIINFEEGIDGSNRVATLLTKKNGNSPLKIENLNKLKVLLVTSSCNYIDGIRVSAPSLDVIAFVDTFFKKDDFFLVAPRLQCSRDFWVRPAFTPHIGYNISKEKKIIWHEELVNLFGKLLISAGSLSVSLDLNNPTEFERLQKVLCAWTHKMSELEIIFKDNNDPHEEYDSWTKKKNKYKNPFPNAKFRVDTVCMHNFSGSEEEFALASCLIKQGTVVKNMMVKTTSFPAKKKLEIETAVAKLRAVRTIYQQKLTIKCF